jgi:hypothetical protein
MRKKNRAAAAILALLMAGMAGLAGSALAGPNAGGTLILHDTNILMIGTPCENMGTCNCGQPPADCLSADTELDGSSIPTPGLFYVYAAFPSWSSPRLLGLTWGLHYSSDIAFSSYGMCGDFELNDNNWPASDTGSSVTFNSVQTSPLVLIYWFWGYRYGDPSVLSLRDNPSQGGWFGDDSVPAILDPIAGYGTLGFDMPGQPDCPVPAPEGACCLPDGSCLFVVEADCPGVWTAPGVPCDPSPCPQLGACCLADGSCVIVLEPDCTGTWMGSGVECSPGLCLHAFDACCFEDGTCTETTPAACTGVYQGDWTNCDPNPCPQPPTPVERASWGQIKKRYR